MTETKKTTTTTDYQATKASIFPRHTRDDVPHIRRTTHLPACLPQLMCSMIIAGLPLSYRGYSHKTVALALAWGRRAGLDVKTLLTTTFENDSTQ